MNNTKLFTVSFLVTLLVFSSLPLYLYLNSPKSSEHIAANMNKFSSYEEMQSFLETSSSSSVPYNYWVRSTASGDTMLESGDFVSSQIATPEAAPAESASISDYSKTNIQVEGVDEADIVKTDGEYIYIVSGANLTIVKAYPPDEAQVLSKITLTGTIMGIFINGDKLAIFTSDYGVYPLYDVSVIDEPNPSEKTDESTTNSGASTVIETNESITEEESVVPEPPDETPTREPEVIWKPEITWEPPTTSIKVYDVSNKGNPLLTRDFAVDGNYLSARMIGDYIYVVATQYTFYLETNVVLPRVHSDNETIDIPATDIYYYNSTESSHSFTTIASLNIKDDAQEPTHETILLGSTTDIYVSQNNIYLIFPEYPMDGNSNMETTIQRINVDKQSIIFAASGEVPGYVLNQFSMDEYNGYFRIATTVNNVNWRTFAEEATSENNVYVLDMNLKVVGKLEDLAPGEQIYSVRFMSNRCYLVSFRNIDPLFVIDLTDPTAPKVLGQLKVTGYSGYLHPYDENHIIGIGKETEYDAEEDFAWYQGVKISLFDVSDVSNPVEIAKYEIGDRGTDSQVLWDHKALLFDKELNLLVIPVSEAKIDPSKYNGTVPDWAYGEQIWQGVYVFNISTAGLELKGKITHMDDNTNLSRYGYYYGYDYSVQRSLYIDDVLYTISGSRMKMNNLNTLAEINTIDII